MTKWLRTEVETYDTPDIDDDSERWKESAATSEWTPAVFNLEYVIGYIDAGDTTLIMLQGGGAHVIRTPFAMFAAAMKAWDLALQKPLEGEG